MLLATERDKIAHLLRRFGLGASEAELDYYGPTLKEAIQKLVNYDKVESRLPDIQTFFNAKDNLKPQQVKAWWLTCMLRTRRPLEEKMALFWHDHFATSFAKVNNGELMYRQNTILRDYATGNFPELLAAASKDPAMLFWLDGQLNVKGKPNENFAREVMELFTLGVGNYTERDVQEAARAVTGWQLSRPDRNGKLGSKVVFLFRPALHDDGSKTILGKTANFDGDGLLDLLCAQIQTSRYLTKKIWEWFVWPKVDAATVDRFATPFMKSGLDVKTLLLDIMQSKEFYSDKAVRSQYKNPVDFCVPTMRQLGLGELEVTPELKTGAIRAAITSLATSTKSMGMELLAPPDVAGWEGGEAWISSATMVERIKWADRLFGVSVPNRKIGVIRAEVAYLFETGKPEDVVDRLLSVFDVQMPPAKRSQMVAVAQQVSGGTVTDSNANKVAGAVGRLIFGSPEFQFA